VISLRFRAAWKAQGRDFSDLPYKQPLFPVLPILVVVLCVLMFIAQGYASVVEQPFSVRNIIATYIGLVLYILAYIGYGLYECFVMKAPHHFVPLMEVDLDTHAVWRPGEGKEVLAREAEEERLKDMADAAHPGLGLWWWQVMKYIDFL
jgi:amino acid permease